MTVSTCNRFYIQWLPAVASVLALILLGFSQAGRAQSPAGTPKAGAQADKIHVLADALTSDGEARFAEFSGNVRATQGNTVITSDRLKIFYSERAAASGKLAGAESAVKKIVASGNVRIAFDDRVATALEAVYNSESKVVVLSGSPAKIVSGTDSITGEKITYDRSDGRITVESGRGSRVEAVIHSEGSGLK